MKVFAADGLTIQQFNEPAGGQVVFHLHIHVIPRKIGVSLKPPASFKEEPAVLSDQARRSRPRSRAGDPRPSIEGRAAVKRQSTSDRWTQVATSPLASARDPLDLGADQALDHAGEIVVEP